MEVLLATEQYWDYFRTWCWPNVFPGYDFSILANSSSLSGCITAESRDGKKLSKKEKDTHLSPVLHAMIYFVQHGKVLQKEFPGIGLTILLGPITFESLSLVLNLWAPLSDSHYLPKTPGSDNCLGGPLCTASELSFSYSVITSLW